MSHSSLVAIVQSGPTGGHLSKVRSPVSMAYFEHYSPTQIHIMEIIFYFRILRCKDHLHKCFHSQRPLRECSKYCPGRLELSNKQCTTLDDTIGEMGSNQHATLVAMRHPMPNYIYGLWHQCYTHWSSFPLTPNTQSPKIMLENSYCQIHYHFTGPQCRRLINSFFIVQFWHWICIIPLKKPQNHIWIRPFLAADESIACMTTSRSCMQLKHCYWVHSQLLKIATWSACLWLALMREPDPGTCLAKNCFFWHFLLLLWSNWADYIVSS